MRNIISQSFYFSGQVEFVRYLILQWLEKHGYDIMYYQWRYIVIGEWEKGGSVADGGLIVVS